MQTYTRNEIKWKRKQITNINNRNYLHERDLGATHEYTAESHSYSSAHTHARIHTDTLWHSAVCVVICSFRALSGTEQGIGRTTLRLITFTFIHFTHERILFYIFIQHLDKACDITQYSLLRYSNIMFVRVIQ